MMSDIFLSVVEWLEGTQIPEQLQAVDLLGLFQNTYFLIPFIALMVYFLYKQDFNNIFITAIVIGLWWFSGSSMVREAVVDGELQLGKVLPVVGIGGTGVGALVYLLFIKDD